MLGDSTKKRNDTQRNSLSSVRTRKGQELPRVAHRCWTGRARKQDGVYGAMLGRGDKSHQRLIADGWGRTSTQARRAFTQTGETKIVAHEGKSGERGGGWELGDGGKKMRQKRASCEDWVWNKRGKRKNRHATTKEKKNKTDEGTFL